MSARPLDESVVLVTGATSGIGLVTAQQFGARGCKVVLSGRREELGEDAARSIRGAGGDALFVRTDMDDDSQVEALVARTVEHYGRLDIAFNNAGIEGDPLTPLHEQTMDNFDRVMRTNVRSVLNSMKFEVPAMLAAGGGSIVNNASIAGLIGFPGASVYCASKHAVIGLTRVAALEYSAKGIRVNAVAPAVIETGMFERFAGDQPGMVEMVTGLHPIGRLGQSEEVAQAVVWLASPENSFTTGVILPVDGGWTAQ